MNNNMVSTNHILSVLALFSVSPRNMPPLREDASTDHDHRRHNIKPTISSSSNYGAQRNHPTTYDDNPTFKGPLILDQKDSTDVHRERIHHHYLKNERLKNIFLNDETKLLMPTTKVGQATPTATILKLIVDHLARKDAPVDVKEVAESVEFYLRCGKRLIGAAKRVLQNNHHAGGRCDDFVSTITIQDLCSGHGLTGLIFLACNPPGKLLFNNKQILLKTLLTDQVEPQSHSLLKDCIAEICPWIAEAGVVTFETSSLTDFTANSVQEWKKNNSDDTTSSTAKRNQATIIVSTHACGSLTDKVLQYAINVQAASLAVMPCCYTGTDSGVPYGVRRMLGVGMSADVRRCFELQEHGYHTDLAAIPRAVTAMNRIIVAERRS